MSKYNTTELKFKMADEFRKEIYDRIIPERSNWDSMYAGNINHVNSDKDIIYNDEDPDGENFIDDICDDVGEIIESGDREDLNEIYPKVINDDYLRSITRNTKDYVLSFAEQLGKKGIKYIRAYHQESPNEFYSNIRSDQNNIFSLIFKFIKNEGLTNIDKFSATINDNTYTKAAILYNNEQNQKIYIRIIQFGMQPYAATTYILFSKYDIIETFVREILSQYVNKITHLNFYKSNTHGTYEIFSEFTNEVKLVKHNSICDKLINIIKSLITKEHLYRQLNFSSGLNILLVGQPGVGKTTIIKTIANELFENVYSITATSTVSHPSILASLLSGKSIQPMKKHDNSHVNIKLIVFEDFDRFYSTIIEKERAIIDNKVNNVNSTNTRPMQDLLNTLDGAGNMYGVVRFFTCNNPKEILENQALRSRMHHIIEIDRPNINDIKEFYNNIFTEPNDEEKINQLCQIIEPYNLTLRDVNNIIGQYMYLENTLDCVIENIANDIEKRIKLVNDNLQQ